MNGPSNAHNAFSNGSQQQGNFGHHNASSTNNSLYMNSNATANGLGPDYIKEEIIVTTSDSTEIKRELVDFTDNRNTVSLVCVGSM